MWETWVGCLVCEGPVCLKAAGPTQHNCWSCALSPRAARAARPQTLGSMTADASAGSSHTTARLHTARRRGSAHCNERKTLTQQHGPAKPNRINLKNFLSVLLFCKHIYLALIFEGFFTKELILSFISELL